MALSVLAARAASQESPGLAVTALRHRLGMLRSAVFHFLAKVSPEGNGGRDPVIGTSRHDARPLLLPSTALNKLDIDLVARHTRKQFCDGSEEPVHLVIPIRDDEIPIDRIGGRQLAPRALHGVRQGAARLPAAGSDRAASSQGARDGHGQTIFSPETPRQQVAEIRQCRHAI